MTDANTQFDQWAGLTGPKFNFPIELGKVREFAQSLFSNHPQYLESLHPVIPPTFPVVAGYLWGYILESASGANPLAAVGIDANRSLDAEQEYSFYGPPPRAGVELSVETSVQRVWSKQGRRGGSLTFYRTRADYRDVDDHLVGTNLSTSVVPSEVPDTPSVPHVDYMDLPFCRYDEPRDQLMAIKQRGWRELVETDGPGGIEMPALTLTDIVTYQIVSGSRGAGHHDVIAARAEGWPNYYSVAMLHGGLLATYATNWLGPENVRRLKLRFLDVTWPGDILTYAGTVKRKYREGAEQKVDIELTCTRPDGQCPTIGWGTFIVP